MTTQLKNLEITEREAIEYVNGNGDKLATRPPNEMELIQAAVLNGAPIEVIERLSVLKERFDDRVAEREFSLAMNAAQSELGPVAGDVMNEQTKKLYASYSALDRRIRPVYTKNGFSLSFDTGEAPPEMVLVLCYVSHKLGHTRTYRALMPADGKGAKGGDVMTKTHASAAAMSYGMRYLLKMIFNIAIGEEDKDGNTGGTYEHLRERLEWIRNCHNGTELRSVYDKAYAEAFELEDMDALKALVAAKDQRKEELAAGRQ